MEKKVKTERKKNFICSLGRRKRSVARVRLFAGKGEMLVNNMPVTDYFKNIPAVYYLRPFEATGTTGKYYATARIVGGGKMGQLKAFVHGVSRALSKVEEANYRPLLKPLGLLTRDPREKERRKFGLAQGARARKQSPKR